MVRDYKPVEVKAMPWAKLLALIEPHGTKGIALFDLAKDLKIALDDAAFQRGIDYLLKQGRIRLMMGHAKSGMPCRVVQVVAPEISRRERTSLPDKPVESDNTIVDLEREQPK